MCSHEEITWKVVDNTIAHKMIDNSLIHKFVQSNKIRKRTKLMNAEIKKRGIIKDYNEYMALKESIIQKVPIDHDTDDTDNLSDIDYSIIHNSGSKLKQYRNKFSTSRVLINNENKEISQPIKKRKRDSTIKSIEKRTKKSVEKQTRKSVNISQQKNSISQIYSSSDKDDDDNERSQTMRTTRKNNNTNPIEKNTKKPVNVRQQEDFLSQPLFTSDENDDEKESQVIQKNSKAKSVVKKTKKFMDIGWQEVTKNKNTFVSDNRQHTNNLNINKENISQSNKCNHPIVDFNERPLSPKSESQVDIVLYTTKSMSKDIPQDHNNLIAVIPKSDSPSNPESNSQDIVFHDTTLNHKDSEAVANETISELDSQLNTVVCEMNLDEKVPINREDDVVKESNVMANELNHLWNLQISLNDEMSESKLDTSKNQFSPINDPPSSIDKNQPSALKDEKYEKPIKVEEKSSVNVKNQDDALTSKSSELINNVKRNLSSALDTVDCIHQVSSPNASHDQQKDSGIDEDSQDTFKQDKTENQNNAEDNLVKKISVPSEHAETEQVAEEVQEGDIKDINLKIDDKILKEEDTADDTEVKKPKTDVSELKQTEEEDTKINNEAKMPEDSCNVEKKQLQPKVMFTEVVNKRYKIVCKKNDYVNITRKDTACNFSNPNTSLSYPNAVGSDVDDTFIQTANEISVPQEMGCEEDEEDDANVARCVSPQMKKRLQQLNLTVDSSESSDNENENEFHSIAGSNGHTNNSDANHSNAEDEMKLQEVDIGALNSDGTREDVNDYSKLGPEDQENGISKRNVKTSQGEDNTSAEKELGNDEGSHASGERHNEFVLSNDRNVDDEDGQCQENVRYRPCNVSDIRIVISLSIYIYKLLLTFTPLYII